MRMLEGLAARVAAGVRSSHLTDDRDALASPAEQAAQAHWAGLTPVLQVTQTAEACIFVRKCMQHVLYPSDRR